MSNAVKKAMRQNKKVIHQNDLKARLDNDLKIYMTSAEYEQWNRMYNQAFKK